MNPTAGAIHAVSISAHAIVLDLSLVRDEIAYTAGRLDAGKLTDLAGVLGKSGRVFVAGARLSGLVLRMAAMRLMHLGLTVHVAADTTTPAISSGDLLVLASGSGTTSGVVKSAETVGKAGARIAAFTTNAESPLGGLADAVVIIPAAHKTDHASTVPRQYSGSLFEQVLFLATEALFQSVCENTDAPAEELWLRHANLE